MTRAEAVERALNEYGFAMYEEGRHLGRDEGSARKRAAVLALLLQPDPTGECCRCMTVQGKPDPDIAAVCLHSFDGDDPNRCQWCDTRARDLPLPGAKEGGR